MVKHTKGFKGLSKKVLSAILAASMIMTSSSFVMAAEPTEEPVPVESTANDVETTEETEVEAEEEAEVEETKEAANEVATFSEPAPATDAVGQAQVDKKHELKNVKIKVDDGTEQPVSDDKTFTVNPQDYAGGTKVKPEIKITYSGTPLKEGTDYSLSYSNNTDSTAVSEEAAKVTVNFKNDYDDLDSVTATFNILQIDLADNDVTVEYAVQDAYVYTGKEIHPAVNSVKVTKGDKEYTLTADDYTVEPTGETINKGLVNANKDLQVKIVGKNNYTGQSGYSGTFTIQPADIADGTTVTVNPTAFVKDYATAAENVEKNIVVIDNGTGEEVKKSDYVVQWYNEKTGKYSTSIADVSFDVGTHTLRVYGKRDSVNYKGKGNFDKDSYVEVSFEIVESTSLQMEVDSALITAKFSGFKYNSDEEALVAEYTGKDYHVDADDVKLTGLNTNEVTYKVADGEWINAGEYEITVEGKNSYAGETATIPVKILPRALNTDDDKLKTNIKVEASQGLSTAGGTGDLIVKVTDNTLKDEDGVALNEVVTLEEGKDYTYVTKTENDKTYVVITGIGNYTTAISKDVATYTQEVVVDEKRINIADSSITATVSGTYKYNGSEQKPGIDNVELMGADGKVIPRTRLQIDYRDNINAGTGYVIITVKDGADKKYYGVREIPFEIEGEAFDDVFTLAEIKDFDKDSVTKNDIERAIRVVYQNGGATYASPANATRTRIEVEITKDGKEVDWSKDIAGGVYNVKVTPSGKDGSGRYQGELTTTFNVIGDDLKTSGAKIADIADQVYTSEAIEPDVVVTIGNKTLEEGKDYTVSYTDNVKGGEATAIVTGIGEYSGTIEKNFNITRAAQSIVMTNPLQEEDLANGSRTTKSNVCTLKLDTTMADEDTKYTYKSSDLSVATVNAGKITYQGVGECTITVSAAATDSCEAASLDITVKVGKPGQPTFTPSVTSKTAKKSITVTSSTVRGADGFEVQYSVRSDWWRASTVDFDGTNNKLYRQTIKTYHSNKKYYIRVRAYQVVDGAKVYSDWSPAKTATTK